MDGLLPCDEVPTEPRRLMLLSTLRDAPSVSSAERVGFFRNSDPIKAAENSQFPSEWRMELTLGREEDMRIRDEAGIIGTGGDGNEMTGGAAGSTGC